MIARFPTLLWTELVLETSCSGRPDGILGSTDLKSDPDIAAGLPVGPSTPFSSFRNRGRSSGMVIE
jgi:hypothetical protein